MTKRFKVGDGKPRIDRAHAVTSMWFNVDLGANFWRWTNLRVKPAGYVVGGIMWGRR